MAILKYGATEEADKLVVDRVSEMAIKHGVSRSQIALGWLLHKKPVVAPIIGATKLSHLESSVGSLSVKLTADEISFLEEPYVPHPVVGPN